MSEIVSHNFKKYVIHWVDCIYNKGEKGITSCDRYAIWAILPDENILQIASCNIYNTGMITYEFLMPVNDTFLHEILKEMNYRDWKNYLDIEI